MWNIIAKDLYLQRVRLALVAVLSGVAMGVIIVGTDLRNGGLYPAVLIYTLGLTYTYTFSSCFHEDKNKSISFLRSLPVPARMVVNAKFAAMIVLETVLLILLSILLYLGNMLGTPALSAFVAEMGFVVLAVLSPLLLNSIVLLMYFSWGYNNIQWVYTMSFFVFFFGGMSLGRILHKIPLFFPGISQGQGYVLGAALVLLVVFLCWKGSVSALSKKDLIC